MVKADISAKIAGISIKSAITAASGTFGYGDENMEERYFEGFGAIFTKSITMEEREGNAPPRTAETASGMLNSIGLQNIGIERFIKEKAPRLTGLNIPCMVNVAGRTVEEYCEVCRKLEKVDGISGIELNISCPNVKQGGMEFGRDPKQTHRLVRMARKATRLPILAKLTPNVGNIGEIADAAERGGADGITAINTLQGMAINAKRGRAVLGAVFGGLSGPAIKPVALRCVWEIRKACRLPIVGMGGIMSGEDAAEFLMAGAAAVAVGTANLLELRPGRRLSQELEDFMGREGWRRIEDIVGAAQRT